MHLGISRKIYLGFALILILLTAGSVVSWHALRQAADGFVEYRGLARGANLCGRLQANMLMVRMNVKDFIITGSEKDVQEYRDYLEKTQGFLDQAQQEIQKPNRAALIDEIAESVVDYEAGFAQVLTLQDKRHQTVNEVLNVQGPQMERKLTEIMLSANQDQDAAAAYRAGLALRHLLLARLYVIKFLDTNDQPTVDRVNEEFSKMQEQVGVMDQELKDPDRRALLAEVTKLESSYKSGFQNLVETIYARNEIIENTLDKIGPQIATAAEDVKLSVKADQDTLGPALQAANTRAVIIVVSVAGVALTLGIVISILLARSIIKPIINTSQALQDIAEGEGDLTRRLDDSHQDELGTMAKWFNLFVSRIESVIREMAGNATTLTTESTELLATATDLTNGAGETSKQSASVAAGAEEMSANMNNMASSAGQVSDNIKTVAAAVEEMLASVTDVAQNAQNAAGVADNASKLANQSNERISELGAAADEIGKVIEVIQDIAEQTNLLALNATIEAARAGEAGKGFAVVATEVKELAKQTGDATEDIRKRVQGIQSSPSDAVTSIGEISGVITQVNEVSRVIATSVDEQSSTMKEIAQNVAQTASAAEVISTGVAESASASSEITQTIAGVDQTARLSAAGAEQTQKAGEGLSNLAEQLQSLVNQFKTS